MEGHILLHFFPSFFGELWQKKHTMQNTVPHGVDINKQFPLYTSSGHGEKH